MTYCGGLRGSFGHVVHGSSVVVDEAGDSRTKVEPPNGCVDDEAAEDGLVDDETASKLEAPDPNVAGVEGALGDEDLWCGRKSDATSERKLLKPGLSRESMHSGARQEPAARKPERPLNP